MTIIFINTITYKGKTYIRKKQTLQVTLQSKMSSMTTAIISKFTESIDINKEYGLSEILAILSADYKAIKAITTPTKTIKTSVAPGAPRKAAKKLVFDSDGNSLSDDSVENKQRKKSVKRERDADGNILKKRAPSAYNIFVKDKIAEIKVENPSLNSKEAFKMAIEAWNKQKAEKVVEVTADSDEVEEDDN